MLQFFGCKLRFTCLHSKQYSFNSLKSFITLVVLLIRPTISSVCCLSLFSGLASPLLLQCRYSRAAHLNYPNLSKSSPGALIVGQEDGTDADEDDANE